ncbi:MAG: DUF4124 domain-containing protein [Pseudomonadota bacterium]
MQGIAQPLWTSLRPALVAVLALGLAASPAMAATIYKSVDEQGNVQFTQTPPADRESESVDPAYATPTAPVTEEEPTTEGESETASEDKATDPSTEVKVIDREKAREACEKARAQREAIANQGNNLMVQDAEGKYRPMDEEQRTERLRRLDEIIEETCVE